MFGYDLAIRLPLNPGQGPENPSPCKAAATAAEAEASGPEASRRPASRMVALTPLEAVVGPRIESSDDESGDIDTEADILIAEESALQTKRQRVSKLCKCRRAPSALKHGLSGSLCSIRVPDLTLLCMSFYLWAASQSSRCHMLVVRNVA